MAGLSLSAVSTGIASLINVPALTSLCGGRVYDDIPQPPTFPFVWYEVSERSDERGFGTGGLPLVDLRVHACSTYEGAKEAQGLIAAVIGLLKDQALTATGYQQAGRIEYRRTVLLPDEIIQGVKCRELVAFFELWVEET
jgi:hypothetical protein